MKPQELTPQEGMVPVKQLDPEIDLKAVELDFLNRVQSALELVQTYVDKPYYQTLTQLPIIPSAVNDLEAIADTTWLFQITKLAYESGDREFYRKLNNVISAVGLCGGALIMKIDYKPPEIKIYIGAAERLEISDIQAIKDTLRSSFKGNFPGSELQEVGMQELCSQMTEIRSNSISYNCVTSISCMAQPAKDTLPTVGLERILHAAGEEPFSLLILGEPMSRRDLAEMRKLYEGLATQLSKLVNLELSQQQGSSASDAISLSEAINLANSINRSQTAGHSVTDGSSEGTNTRDNPNPSDPLMDNLYAASAILSALRGDMVSICAMNILRDTMRDKPDQMTDHQSSTNHAETLTEQQSEGHGSTSGWSQQKGISRTITTNQGLSVQYSMVNHTAKGIYDRVMDYLEWMKQSANFGMFYVSAYVLSAQVSTNMSLASRYASMMNGEGLSRTYGINTWVGEESSRIRTYLATFQHPSLMHPKLTAVTPAVSVSAVEMAQNIIMPRKSIGRLSVLSYEPFGRNVVSRSGIGGDRSLNMGCIYHMGESISIESVPLNLDSLSRHSFIAGANGTGKSTAIFTLLKKIYGYGTPFMVIEPAKGEYRRVFKAFPDIKVYSPMKIEDCDLLRLNLFWFRDGVDVNEHVEKLTELFCSCWPMYAAMPQVLREAIFNAYESCGWDLENSENPYGRNFPTVGDVCAAVQRKIDDSAFSAEVKGNYIGSILTRMQSLDRGIYRRIFNSGNLDDEALFEHNVILDISRPDADDVKALLMGLVIIRHFEYCAVNKSLGDTLEHLTVLEEAHTLLAEKTASGEGAEIGHKSIEMITRCIAELGGFGQGFLIADQAPGLLDRSVIRNTNTKMLFRLPDLNDCQLTGKAIGLTDQQCSELSRLPRGVCAMHQLNWEEAVLCQIHPEKWQMPETQEVKSKSNTQRLPRQGEYLACLLMPFSVIGKRLAIPEALYEAAQAWAVEQSLPGEMRLILLKAIHPREKERSWSMLLKAVRLLNLELPEENRDALPKWTEVAVASFKPLLDDRRLILTLIEALLDLEIQDDHVPHQFHDIWFDYICPERTD